MAELLETVDYMAVFVSAKGNASIAFGDDCVAVGTDLEPCVAAMLFGVKDADGNWTVEPLLVKKRSRDGNKEYLGSENPLHIWYRVTGENSRTLEDGKVDHTTFVYIEKIEPATSFELGAAYLEGKGHKQDDALAFTYFLKSAEEGDEGGQYLTANSYARGVGVEQNLEEAEKWCQTIIDGDSDAEFKKLARKLLKSILREIDDEYLSELDSLVGLEQIKKDVRSLMKFLRVQQKRRERGLKTQNISYHCVFTGNPGTGKTTVARVLAKIYYATGVVKTDKFVEVGKGDLVAEYLGQTPIKTNAVIDSALDGVLFIDEAYSLTEGRWNEYGREAVDTLIQRMENDRDRLVVIVAGYTDEMKEFISSNPGLKSRFTRCFEFPDYSVDELTEIFVSIAKDNDYQFSSIVSDKVRSLVSGWIESKDRHFGNAREMRNLFENVVRKQSDRLADIVDPTDRQLRTIKVCDIPVAG